MGVLEHWRRQLLMGLMLCVSCSAAAPSGDRHTHAQPTSTDAPALLDRPGLCEREDRSDLVRDLFCKDTKPAISSLAELEAGLGIPSPVGMQVDRASGAAFLAHSTSLSGHVVSELNPRAIVVSRNLFVAFSRGLQQVELAAVDRIQLNQRNFYLVEFRQACNDAAQGCGPADLYTANIESGWRALTLLDDEDLKNTASDCRQCHQRGAGKPKLLMREFYSPWPHFFGPDQDEPMTYPEPTGSALLRDYMRAQGDDAYANVPASVMQHVVGVQLQLVVDTNQPLYFEGSKITGERWPWRDGGYASQPERSATWDAAYAAFKRGEQLPLPFYGARATDADKQASLTQAIQRYRAGELDASEFPDLSDIFPDDPQLRAEIGLQTEPSASPAETLIQACGSCHNDVLDQSISRARFNIALGRMSRAELDLAVTRMLLERDDAAVMPPPGRRQIAPEKLQELVEYLESSERTADDAELLERAAQAGMAGGAKRYP